MDIFKLSEKFMRMDDDTWLRHANPWSVYTRLSCLPLMALAIWSRVWIGWWSLSALAVVLLWTWYNPRMASTSGDVNSWAYKGVMGERIFLNRKLNPIPQHHQRMGYLLTALSMVGVFLLGHGLYVLVGWEVISGLLLTIVAKLWFVDRMVWLYEDKRQAS